MKNLKSLLGFFAIFTFAVTSYGACNMGSCSSLGQIRYASNKVQYCNGSAWINVEDTSSACGASLSISPSSQSGMDVNGGGGSSQVYGSYVTFTVTNNGVNTSSSLTTQLTNTGYWEFGTNNCSGQTLAGGASCTVQIRPKSSVSGPLSSTFKVNTHNAPTAALSGTASNFANASCSATIIDDCALSTTAHGGADGSCISDGACSYNCSNGTWNEVLNSCGDGCGLC